MSLLSRNHEERPLIEEVIKTPFLRKAMLTLISEYTFTDRVAFTRLRYTLEEKERGFKEELRAFFDGKVGGSLKAAKAHTTNKLAFSDGEV
jgi:hypothetical protein